MKFLTRRLKLLTSIALLSVLVLNHQGCGNTALMVAPGNGSGYEGATPDSDRNQPSAGANIYLTAYFVKYGICNDQMDRVSIIQRIDGQYRLMRDNCQDLTTPMLLNGEQVHTDPSTPNLLFFNGQEYQKESYD